MVFLKVILDVHGVSKKSFLDIHDVLGKSFFVYTCLEKVVLHGVFKGHFRYTWCFMKVIFYINDIF